ncbi:PqqD family protein [Brevibacillus laterosporus]|uniref:PqqD family protein n=1 Tax=Brevibacillus laterosporus TaxID=1465 RepID=UPI0018CF81A2|nr:PqqD family protein [Brevibacillus laterosporus]MBG9797321.1 membrane protein [Brevibacillus laterosporus]MED1912585.1 PqqD family protein [Brevibacillus laterosporus]
MELTNSSMLRMHPLQKRQVNEEETIIGRPDKSEYIMLPTFAVEIIEMLDQGQTITQVAEEMERRFGEPVDVHDFALDLINEYQFVYTVDGTVVNEKEIRIDHFPWISERVGKVLFNKLTFSISIACFLSAVTLLFFQHEYFPVFTDIFSSPSLTASLLLAVVVNYLFLFIHETAHLTAVRSLGVGSRIGFSHRLFFPVAETNMSDIVLVEPHKRYTAYLAGMSGDALFFSIGVWLLYANDVGAIMLSNFMLSFIKLMNLNFLMALGFQFMFFMRTDIYYVFTTFFGCNNLFDNTQLFFRKFYRKWTPAEQEVWDTVDMREKQVIRWYSIFFLLGFCFALYFFFNFFLLQSIEIIRRITTDFLQYPILSWQFVDGILLLLLTLLPFGIVLWSWNRQRKMTRNVTRQVS